MEERKYQPFAKGRYSCRGNWFWRDKCNPVIAREFERIFYSTFNKKEVEAYLCPNQFGYRKGGSCINASTNDASYHSRRIE